MRRYPGLVTAALLALCAAAGATPTVTGGFCLPSRSTDQWIETWTEIENGDASEFKGTLEVELPGYRTAGPSARRDVAIAPGTKKRFFLVVGSSAAVRPEFVVRLRDERGRDVLQKKVAGSWVGGPEKTLVVISRPEQPAVLFSSLSLAKLAGRYQRWDADESHLPEHVEGWTAAGLVVLAGVDLAAWSEEQRRSLCAWVDIGGQVLLLPGSDRKWFESAGVKQLVDMGRVSEADPEFLQIYFGKNNPETVLSFEKGGSGALVPPAGNLTQVWPVGRGRVAAITFDTTIPSLAKADTRYRGLSGFAEDVLNALPPQPLPWADYAKGGSTWSWRGFVVALGQDLVGYPATAAVLFGLFVYVLIIGPANFWILRRKHAPAMTVLTVPAAGIAVTLLILVLGWFLRDNRVQANRVTVLRPGPGGRWDAREHIVAVAGKRREAVIDSPVGRMTEMTDGRSYWYRNIAYGGADGAAVRRAFEPNEPAYYYAVGRRDIGTITARAGNNLTVVNGTRYDIEQAWYYEAGARVLNLGPIPSGGSYRGSLTFAPRPSPFKNLSDESPTGTLLRALDPQFLRTTEIAVIAILKATAPPPTVDGKPAEMKSDRTVIIIPVEREP
ncbi:MAG: hypothetical protein FD180_1089 [Planctomycetota bacterium]|nr:MAG: hypothetical protein FD180_1089 [Planctomycetota bacterium]